MTLRSFPVLPSYRSSARAAEPSVVASGQSPRHVPMRATRAGRIRLLAAGLLVLAFVGSGCSGEPHPPEPMGPPPMSVTTTFMTDPNAFTPAESDAPLDFALTLAVRNSRPTLVLSGRYNLPAAVRARYGEDPRHAIYLVAINTEAFRIHAAPVGPPLSPTSEPPAFAGDVFADEATGEPLRGVFSVDVPVALGLPPLSAPYEFFLWIDEHVTPRQSFINPSNTTPREGHEVLPITGPAMLLQRTESDAAIPSITIQTTEGSSVVEGVVAHELDTPEPVPLLYMAVERPVMQYGYARVVLPHDDESRRLHYDLDVRHLFFNHEPTGRVWVLGMMGSATATPAALRVPERPAPVDGGVPAAPITDATAGSTATAAAPASAATETAPPSEATANVPAPHPAAGEAAPAPSAAP
ncbi:MAG: hypothetical protein R3B40_07995 [Polyangiales bacterium]|nr:hypothetical protein [Myxococcales bacterium]